jgi:hypothetical protein
MLDWWEVTLYYGLVLLLLVLVARSLWGIESTMARNLMSRLHSLVAVNNNGAH